MIRRKLTRLEVTLDDTKELDDLFSKPTTQLGLSSVLATATAPSTSVSSKLLNQFYQKQLTLSSKQSEVQNTELNSNLEQTTAIGTSSSSAIAQATDLIAEANSTELGVEGSSNFETPQVGYNPQPYNPSNRFQINKESQQLR